MLPQLWARERSLVSWIQCRRLATLSDSTKWVLLAILNDSFNHCCFSIVCFLIERANSTTFQDHTVLSTCCSVYMTTQICNLCWICDQHGRCSWVSGQTMPKRDKCKSSMCVGSVRLASCLRVFCWEGNIPLLIVIEPTVTVTITWSLLRCKWCQIICAPRNCCSFTCYGVRLFVSMPKLKVMVPTYFCTCVNEEENGASNAIVCQSMWDLQRVTSQIEQTTI